MYFVNPVIKNKDTLKATYEEGCLSVPNQFAEVDRPSKCEIEYLDYDGNKKLLKADGLLATCLQHEMDHLEGILFIDYLSKLKKSAIDFHGFPFSVAKIYLMKHLEKKIIRTIIVGKGSHSCNGPVLKRGIMELFREKKLPNVLNIDEDEKNSGLLNITYFEN